MAQDRKPPQSPAAPKKAGPIAWAGLGLSWLVPGGGFLLCGRWRRGLIHLGVIAGTFMLGVLMHGGVIKPVWDYKNEDFNLINNITFIVQLWCGLPALLSYAASNAGALKGTFFEAVQINAYHELGSFFMIVAGGLNYFAISNFHDRILKVHARFTAQEDPGAGEQGA